SSCLSFVPWKSLIWATKVCTRLFVQIAAAMASLDPLVQRVLSQQRQLNRQADMYDWNARREDIVDDDDMMPSQMIRETVEELDDDTIFDAMRSMYHSEALMDLLDLVKGTFRGSTRGLEIVNDPVRLEVRRRTLVLELLNIMMDSHVKQRKGHTVFCTQLVDILRREIDILDMPSLPLLIEHILHSIEQAYRNQEETATCVPIPLPTVELLPHLFGRMMYFAKVPLPSTIVSNWDFSDGDPWTGVYLLVPHNHADVSSPALERLTTARWPQRLVCQLVDVFREMELTPAQHHRMCAKFLAQVDVEMTAAADDDTQQPDFAMLPGLLYHLQLFVQHTPPAVKRDVLQCWIQYMLRLATEANRVEAHRRLFANLQFGAQELRAFQATMLYQLDKLVLQDESLGGLLLELLQPSKGWTSVHVALMLLLHVHAKFAPAIDKLCVHAIATMPDQVKFRVVASFLVGI
ncbi:hypothetical protein AaE_013181, partial [Aphanomyces astaci]